MKKLILCAALVVAATGCKALPSKTEAPSYTVQTPSSDEIEAMADAVVQIRKQRFDLPPMPPKSKPRFRALSLPPEPDRWIVVRWDAEPDPFTSYRLEWMALNSSWPLGVFDTPASKVDLVALFKQRNVPPGWYRVNVEAVNEVFLSSAPVAATTLFWWPRQ